ncbi:MAG: hypothetical protein N3D18_04265 [Roseococcus sp.]|nr:hypothetical protein [Roseococcus sp.]
MPPALARFNTFTPAGRAVLVEPQLVELDRLVPSHLDDGRPNPAYPHAEGVQPRDRGAAPSLDQIRALAAGLIPERLAPNVEAGLGAPIVADDLVVESGNGRVLALRRVYALPELAEVAEAYRAFLAAQGFDLSGYRAPVLVSRRVSALTPEERRAFVAEANSRTTLDQNQAELARADAARLDAALDLWRGGEVDSPANAEFVRAFLGALTAEERAGLLTSAGRLSAKGAARLRAALLARAYGDEMGPLLERFLEGQTEGLRRVAGALTDVSARWALLRRAVAAGEVDPGMEVTADLIGAVRLLDDARRRDMTVDGLLAQTDLDRPPLTDTGRAFLAAFHAEPGLRGGTAARATIAQRLEAFVEEAMKARPGPDMFGTPPVRPEEVLAGARQSAPPEPPMLGRPAAPPADPAAQRQAAILRAAEERDALRPAATPAQDPDLAEARRLLGARDVTVPVGDGPDGAVLRGGRELLDEAEEEVAQAAAAAACLAGPAP